MLVSACIITYNQEDYIEQCLEGAIRQIVDFEYEIVIGDDCSNDKTSDICKRYASQYPHLIKYTKRIRNLGMIDNWAETITSCNGKYIALCEGDDYWSDALKLQKQVDFLEENENYVLVGYNAKYSVDGKEQDTLVRKLNQEYVDFSTSDLIKRNPFVTCGVMFKNIKMDKIGSILRNFTVCDKAVFTFLSFDGKCRFYSKPLGFYRQHDKSITSKNRLEYLPFKNEFINRIKHAEFWNDYSNHKFNKEVNEVREYRSKVLTTMALRNIDFTTAIYYSQFVNLNDIKKARTRLIIKLLKGIQKLTIPFN